MTALSQIQERMQAVILINDPSQRRHLLAALRPAARAPTDEMVGVYCNAYRARLAEILEQDLQTVARYLGETLFSHVAAGYIDAHPSDARNARWFSRHAPGFLTRTEPFARWPQVAELAAIELALADAFDAADSPAFAVSDLTATPPEDWAHLTLRAHPAFRRLDMTTNAFDIWQALQSGAGDVAPPTPEVLDAPQALLIWRQDARSRLRALSPAEARGLDALRHGATFAEACEAMALPGADGETVDAAQAVTYLAGWCASGLFAAR